MGAIVSIVIPCYNSGKYLPEAISSVTDYKGNYHYEIIIVDDGSTDIETLDLLKHLEQKGHKVIHQENKGPAAARNTGVRNARAEFILFLDSDNKIRSNSFIDKGVDFFIKNPDFGVFYGNPHFFGNAPDLRTFSSAPFDMKVMLSNNYIDMCSLIRKQTLDDVNGLDENRIIIGHEDWDLWLRIAKSGWRFHFENETLFDYRTRNDSLIAQTMNSKTHNQVLHYILFKHGDILPKYYIKLSQSYEWFKHYYNVGTIGRIKMDIKHCLHKIGFKQFPKKEVWL